MMEGTEKRAGEAIQIPDGLRPLLEAFAKETLKSHPDDLVYFGKVFFDELYNLKESKWLMPKFHSKFLIMLFHGLLE
ncbi:unnamed protein product [Enterobius vermicularis]|uniref:RIIa domain-containing protein n=1 Tax=Enterobius vermicularis TaxID=51028 RepID=A0A0N4VLD4_ENTVE|nr:unnamed protein product [Enterobius vermicularis]